MEMVTKKRWHHCSVHILRYDFSKRGLSGGSGVNQGYERVPRVSDNEPKSRSGGTPFFKTRRTSKRPMSHTSSRACRRKDNQDHYKLPPALSPYKKYIFRIVIVYSTEPGQ
jgi:hypothetical protein